MLFERIGEGLTAYGFKPLRSSESVPRSLRIELRLLDYTATISLLTMIINGRATLKAVAINKGKTYENIYRVHNEHHYLVVPFAEGNEPIINKAFSDAIQKLFEDKKLFEFLAGQ